MVEVVLLVRLFSLKFRINVFQVLFFECLEFYKPLQEEVSIYLYDFEVFELRNDTVVVVLAGIFPAHLFKGCSLCFVLFQGFLVFPSFPFFGKVQDP